MVIARSTLATGAVLFFIYLLILSIRISYSPQYKDSKVLISIESFLFDLSILILLITSISTTGISLVYNIINYFPNFFNNYFYAGIFLMLLVGGVGVLGGTVLIMRAWNLHISPLIDSTGIRIRN